MLVGTSIASAALLTVQGHPTEVFFAAMACPVKAFTCSFK
jgi:hypothetical protein